MIDLIEKNRDAIAELCQRFHVARLEVFGSAATGEFDPARSDVDFLVEFKPLEPGPLADAYFGLLAAFQRLLGRHVDLVTPKAIRNPYLLRSLNETRRALYAA
jgi:predicted nucleotidyltransferase